jgi:deoxyribonuclease V
MSLQEDLRDRVEMLDRLNQVRYVAGVDVGFKEDGKISRAAVTVLSFPDLELVDQAVAEEPTVFPYVPGYLSFREIPPILQALAKLSIEPQLILCDGQGLAHRRRFGLACHLGLVRPIGCLALIKTAWEARFRLKSLSLPADKNAADISLFKFC